MRAEDAAALRPDGEPDRGPPGHQALPPLPSAGLAAAPPHRRPHGRLRLLGARRGARGLLWEGLGGHPSCAFGGPQGPSFALPRLRAARAPPHAMSPAAARRMGVNADGRLAADDAAQAHLVAVRDAVRAAVVVCARRAGQLRRRRSRPHSVGRRGGAAGASAAASEQARRVASPHRRQRHHAARVWPRKAWMSLARTTRECRRRRRMVPEGVARHSRGAPTPRPLLRGRAAALERHERWE